MNEYRCTDDEYYLSGRGYFDVFGYIEDNKIRSFAHLCNMLNEDKTARCMFHQVMRNPIIYVKRLKRFAK